MSDPAVISGAVAVAAIAGTAVTTWLTLRHQRKEEDKRRQHDRHLRLLESGLRAAADFLAAASRTTRSAQALDRANISFDRAKSAADAR